MWQKRDGYSQFATGQRSSAPYCESRMVNRHTNIAMQGVINSVNQVFFITSATVPATVPPIRRGTVTINGTVPVQSFSDDGLGNILDGVTVIGTVNYTTGTVGVTLPTAPTGGTVTITYDSHQGLPVMGVMNFYTQINTKELIVADTKYVNRYNASTNRLDDISPSTLLTGNKYNFMSWVNYPSPTSQQRLLFVNFKDPIQQYDGTTITPYPVYTESEQITGAASGVVGDGTAGPYVINTPASTGIVPGTLSILEPTTPQTVTDNLFGVLQGDGTGTVNYLTGAITVTFNAAVGVGDPINLTYKQLKTPIQTALHIDQFKDRLVVQYTIENGTQFGHRIRISGTGAFGDVFTNDAIGAGVIDIPADTFIYSSDFNRDDLLIFMQYESWALKYTQNDVVPFTLDRLDGTRGSEAPYATITYLNRTSAASTIGLIITDGYSIEKADEKIPDYSFNEIDQDEFKLCFAGSVDTDRDHYLIHPSPGQDKSDRILVTNYDEGNYSVYRLPLSCMGKFSVAFDVSWNDLLIYNTWNEMASQYGNWNKFAYSKGAPISIGGGHEGQIVRLNDIETEDYPVKIRDITVIDSQTIEVTTDFQTYEAGNYIYLEAVGGMTDVNNKQYELLASPAPTRNVFRLLVDSTQNADNFGAYTSGGQASKCIVFDSKTKKFNPFANADKKVSCGWLYFYVSTSGTALTINRNITNVFNVSPCTIDVPDHGLKDGDQIYIDGVGGTTELNGNYYYITVFDQDTLILNDVDATGYGVYTSGGFISYPQNAILQVRCITNDNNSTTQVQPFNPSPYQVNLTSQQSDNGIKKWYKLWINQTARFVQFEVINSQAGSQVQIHAIMPGFAGVGRLV